MNRVILITGGGSGIGRACAKLFCENGDNVYILGRTESKLQNTCDALKADNPNGNLNYVCANISEPIQCKNAIDEVIKKEKQLDVLVNCAGVAIAGPTVNMTEEDWDKTVNINLKGTFFMCKYAIPHLEKSQGNIVNISSDAGVVGNKELAIYCASKGGVTVMTKALALELAPVGIRANSVCPTETDTAMLDQDVIEYGFESREDYEKALCDIYPQKENARFVRPDEVAEAVFYLADNKKAGAVTGIEIMVDFGITAGY